jgi:UDP-glucose 4-epimerase
VVDAYIAAATRLSPQTSGRCYLLGTGEPISVAQLVKKVEESTGRHISIVSGDRRSCQPINIYADAANTKQMLQWAPSYNLNQIIASEWQWRQGNGKQFVQ